MYLLILSQGEHDIDLGLFETLEEGRAFAAKLPGYKCEVEKDEVGYIYESLNLSDIPNYTEVEYRGNIIPLSRFSFVEDTDINIFWKELPVLTNQGNGIVDGGTRVDAYVVDNIDVKEYIESREMNFKRIKEFLIDRGYEAERSFFGSEDGEAVIYRKRGESDWHFLLHMDSDFADGYDEEEILKYIN